VTGGVIMGSGVIEGVVRGISEGRGKSSEETGGTGGGGVVENIGVGVTGASTGETGGGVTKEEIIWSGGGSTALGVSATTVGVTGVFSVPQLSQTQTVLPSLVVISWQLVQVTALGSITDIIRDH